MTRSSLHVLLADDSELFREEMARALRDHGAIVDVARDGHEAVSLTCRRRPDVVLMDLQMPVMDGLEAIRQIMARCPTPILVLTGISASEIDAVSMEALACGALEVAPKPSSLPVPARELGLIVERMRLLASVSVVRHPRANRTSREPAPLPPDGELGLIAIAASTGGPSALATVLGAIPRGFPVPLLIAQHLDMEFALSLTAWLSAVTSLPVALAEHGTRLTPGRVHVIPPAHDAVVDEDLVPRFLPPIDPGRLSSPSADRLFRSMAERLGPRSCGVVLTGMGRDGCRGLLSLREAGGVTIAQDAASSAVDGMPRAAREAGASQSVLSLPEIGPALRGLARDRSSWRPPR